MGAWGQNRNACSPHSEQMAEKQVATPAAAPAVPAVRPAPAAPAQAAGPAGPTFFLLPQTLSSGGGAVSDQTFKEFYSALDDFLPTVR